MIMKTQFITDSSGKKLAVMLPVKEYEKIMEELDDIRLYDEAKNDKSKGVPMADAFKKIEVKRKKHA